MEAAPSFKEIKVLLFMMVVMLRGDTVGDSPDYGDYCTRRMAVKVCPSPPTIDNMDLHTFLGSYYEVGTTARYKLRSQGGGVCAHFNFSVDILPPLQDQTSVVAIDVQNSGVQVMGIESMSALSKIAYSAADVCANAARMCAMMETSSKLSDAVFRMGSVINNILSSFPSDAAMLNQASALINSTVASVRQQLDGLARSVTIVSRIAAELSQGMGPVEPLLRAIRGTVALGDDKIQDLGSIAIGNLTLTRKFITQVASHMSDDYCVELLSEASVLIEQEIELIFSQVTRVQGLLSSIRGPLADMIAADRSFTNATETLVVTTGQAVQHPDQRGNMALKSERVTQPFQIIALEGLPVVGYSSMLVYSCNLDANGDPVGDLFLLSRTPTIPAQTVSTFLSIASKHGIFTDCDSTFVPTLQRGGTCGLPLP